MEIIIEVQELKLEGASTVNNNVDKDSGQIIYAKYVHDQFHICVRSMECEMKEYEYEQDMQ